MSTNILRYGHKNVLFHKSFYNVLISNPIIMCIYYCNKSKYTSKFAEIFLMLQLKMLKLHNWYSNNGQEDKGYTCDSATTELSSLTASSTMRRLGLSLRRRIAVDKSSGLQNTIKITCHRDIDLPTRAKCFASFYTQVCKKL